jgi:hypothetical protein
MDVRMLLENAAYDIALNADSTAVNDANFLKPRLTTLLEILFHNAGDVLRSERMKVD